MMMTTGTLSTVALLSKHDDDNNADDYIKNATVTLAPTTVLASTVPMGPVGTIPQSLPWTTPLIQSIVRQNTISNNDSLDDDNADENNDVDCLAGFTVGHLKPLKRNNSCTSFI